MIKSTIQNPSTG